MTKLRTHAFSISDTDYRLTSKTLEMDNCRVDFTDDPLLAYDDKVEDRVRVRSFTVGGIILIHKTPLPALADQADLEAFRTNVQLICEAIARAHPELLVTFGSKPKYQGGMFGMGVLGVLAAVGLVVGVSMSRLSMDRMIGVAMPVVLLLIIGGAISYSYAPWRPLPRIPIGTLPASIGIVQLAKP